MVSINIANNFIYKIIVFLFQADSGDAERGEYQCVVMIWAGHVASMGMSKGAYKVLVGKPRKKKSTWKTQA